MSQRFFSALRHFYDPTNPDEPYLTDHVWDLADVVLKGVGDQKMDAKTWALEGPARNSYAENFYSWKKGIYYMGIAVKSDETVTKNKYFAEAWRSLGETMHLLADMTVPAHVRNMLIQGPQLPLFLLLGYQILMRIKWIKRILGFVLMELFQEI